jgi:hypothetical protein
MVAVDDQDLAKEKIEVRKTASPHPPTQVERGAVCAPLFAPYSAANRRFRDCGGPADLLATLPENETALFQDEVDVCTGSSFGKYDQ